MRTTKTRSPAATPPAVRLAPVELDDARLDAVAGGVIEPASTPYAPAKGHFDPICPPKSPTR